MSEILSIEKAYSRIEKHKGQFIGNHPITYAYCFSIGDEIYIIPHSNCLTALKTNMKEYNDFHKYSSLPELKEIKKSPLGTYRKEIEHLMIDSTKALSMIFKYDISDIEHILANSINLNLFFNETMKKKNKVKSTLGNVFIPLGILLHEFYRIENGCSWKLELDYSEFRPVLKPVLQKQNTRHSAWIWLSRILRNGKEFKYHKDLFAVTTVIQ